MRQKVRELMGSYKSYILMNQRKERHDFLTAHNLFQILIGYGFKSRKSINKL